MEKRRTKRTQRQEGQGPGKRNLPGINPEKNLKIYRKTFFRTRKKKKALKINDRNPDQIREIKIDLKVPIARKVVIVTAGTEREIRDLREAIKIAKEKITETIKIRSAKSVMTSTTLMDT